MSERAKWERVDGIAWEHRRLRIGPIEAVAVGACSMWEPGWSIGLADDDSAARDTATADEAQSKAEQALREMHDALVEHFAPVLRWECDLHSVATLGQWFLQADSEEWSVMVCPPNGERAVVASGDRCTTRENNRRAAEAALRSLGIAFRVEGES